MDATLDTDALADDGASPHWPAPWDEPAGLPWWRQLWRHGQGAWIGALGGALLVVGLLCAGATVRLPLTTGSSVTAWPHITPIARHATTHTTTRHPATVAAKPASTPPSVTLASLPVPQSTPPAIPTHTKPGDHGRHHK